MISNLKFCLFPRLSDLLHFSLVQYFFSFVKICEILFLYQYPRKFRIPVSNKRKIMIRGENLKLAVFQTGTLPLHHRNDLYLQVLIKWQRREYRLTWLTSWTMCRLCCVPAATRACLNSWSQDTEQMWQHSESSRLCRAGLIMSGIVTGNTSPRLSS